MYDFLNCNLTFYIFTKIKYMNFRISVLVIFVFLLSCEVLEEDNYPCPDGNCDAEFVIDTQQNPGSYRDANGIWHIKYSGLNYFRILGEADPIYDKYLINNLPSIYTAYDSNYFYIPGVVTWTYPVYSYQGLFSDTNMNTAIPVGFQTYTFPQLVQNYQIMNLAGYVINRNPNVNVNHPAYPTYFSTYSRYNYRPTQQMVFFEDMIGQTADIYIKVSWASDWWGAKVEKFYKLSVVFEE